jgi:hypothetical protein
LQLRVADVLRSESESFHVGKPEDFHIRGLCFLWPKRPEYFVVELGLKGDEHGIWKLEFEGDKVTHWSRDD